MRSNKSNGCGFCGNRGKRAVARRSPPVRAQAVAHRVEEWQHNLLQMGQDSSPVHHGESRRNSREQRPLSSVRRFMAEPAPTHGAEVIGCIECTRPWNVPNERWRVYVTEDDPPQAVAYCPDCAAKEFDCSHRDRRHPAARHPYCLLTRRVRRIVVGCPAPCPTDPCSVYCGRAPASKRAAYSA